MLPDEGVCFRLIAEALEKARAYAEANPVAARLGFSVTVADDANGRTFSVSIAPAACDRRVVH